MITRRKFLHGSLMAAIASGLMHESFAGIVQKGKDIPSFDFHCHPGAFFGKGSKEYGGDAGVIKTVTEMNSGKLSGAFFSLVADMPLLERTATGIKFNKPFAAGEALKEYQRQIGILKDFLKALPATLATKASALDDAIKTKRVAAYIAIEGGDFLNDDPGLLEQMYTDGVRSVQIVHYAPNALGDLQTEAPQHTGLSAAGREVVKRMNKLGMVIDMAHASQKTVQDVAGITDAPVILSHSILKMEEDRPIGRRAISPEHAKLISSTGGVIGAWPSGFNKSFEEFVDNTLRLVDVVGIDHVGLGTDMDSNFKPVLDSYLQLPKWENSLKAKGLSAIEVGKIMGGNARRVLEKVIG